MPPLLVNLELGETLFVYLAASVETLAIVLVLKTLKGKFSVYYVSKALHFSEFNYMKIEKLTYSLLIAS